VHNWQLATGTPALDVSETVKSNTRYFLTFKIFASLRLGQD